MASLIWPPVIHLTRLDEILFHRPKLFGKNKAAGAAVAAACALGNKYLFLSESALCPTPAGSVSFCVLNITSDWMVMLSEWMVMVMTNDNDANNNNNVGNDNGNGNGDGDARAWT